MEGVWSGIVIGVGGKGMVVKRIMKNGKKFMMEMSDYEEGRGMMEV